MASITSLLKRAQQTGSHKQGLPTDIPLRPYSIFGEPYVRDYLGLHHKGEHEIDRLLRARPFIDIPVHYPQPDESSDERFNRFLAELQHLVAPKVGVGVKPKLSDRANAVRYLLTSDPDSRVQLHGAAPIMPGSYVPKEVANRIVPRLYGPEFREFVYPYLFPTAYIVEELILDTIRAMRRLRSDDKLTPEVREHLEDMVKRNMNTLKDIFQSDPDAWHVLPTFTKIDYHTLQYLDRYGREPDWPNPNLTSLEPLPPLGRRVERKENEADRFYKPLLQGPRPIKPYYP